MSVRISELLPKPVSVDTGNGSFDVSGLDLDQIVELIGKHREGMAALFQAGMAGGGVTEQLVHDAPLLVRDIIVMGGNIDPKEANLVKKLPATVQLVALGEIWRLTVPQPKKLRELLSVVAENIGELQKQSQESSGNQIASTTSESSKKE